MVLAGRAVLAVGLTLSVAARAAGGEARTLADCERDLASRPDAARAAYCFLETGERLQRQDEAAARLARAIGGRRAAPWGYLYLGLLRFSDRAGSEQLFARAAEQLAARGEWVGELEARVNRNRQLLALGRLAEASREIRRLGEVIRAGGAALSPRHLAMAAMAEASFLVASNRELDRALALLESARRSIGPAGTYPERRELLFDLAAADLAAGSLRAARASSEELAGLARERRDPRTEAYALYGVLRAFREEMADAPRAGARAEAYALARRTLALAIAAEADEVEVKTSAILAQISEGVEARDHLERALALARSDSDRSFALSVEARLLASSDPGRAEESLEAALAAARTAHDPRLVLYALRERMRASWSGGSSDSAWRASQADLAAIEALRQGQAGMRAQPGFFSLFASHYSLIAGNLFRRSLAGSGRRDLQRAFAVSERLRSRSLRDSLAPGDRPAFATLDEVRRSLVGDEALLSFQIAPSRDMRDDFFGGSWLLVVTRDGERLYPLAHRLTERAELRRAVQRFNGFFARRDGSEGRLAHELYRALLARALPQLPPEIDRLIVVPDDALHLLPFAALRPSLGGAPLAARFQLESVPSATLWLAWRRSRPRPEAGGVLVFADPSLPSVSGAALQREAARFAADHRLGSLPFARSEGSAAVRRLGGGSELLVGSGASEAQLKRFDLRPFAILHFAAHAVVDDVAPELSAILLTPGDGRQDGLLLAPEIAALRLAGKVVVLSSCRSAGGQVVRGEGVESLGRSFFAAGAHTVVASLWPLRDAAGEALFARFYDHLGRGESVARALRLAQTERLRNGAPAFDWAGMVVLGDGGAVPCPRGTVAWFRPWLAGLALGLLGAAGTALLVRRRSRVPSAGSRA